MHVMERHTPGKIFCLYFGPRLHCTGATSAPEQIVLRIDYVYTAPAQKLYQIALPFTMYHRLC